MNKTLIKIAIISLVILFQFGCGNNKGYRGSDLEEDKLSTIIFTNKLFNEHMEKKKDRIYVAFVDEIKVGSFGRGWPSSVNLMPGKRIIKLMYYPEEGNKFNGLIFFGAIGAAIGASMIDKSSGKYYLTVEANLEQGKKYRVGIESAMDSIAKEVIYVWVYDSETYKIVGGQKPPV